MRRRASAAYYEEFAIHWSRISLKSAGRIALCLAGMKKIEQRNNLFGDVDCSRWSKWQNHMGNTFFSYCAIWTKMRKNPDGGTIKNMKKKVTRRLIGFVSVTVFLSVFCLAAAFAGGPPLKDNACGACHKDFAKILPAKHPDIGKPAACLTCHKSDPAKAEPTKFSETVHKTHQGGKTKLECGACHAL